MNPKKNKLPGFCPACDKADKVWTTVTREVQQEFRGETFAFAAPVTECKHCGFQILTDSETDFIAVKTADEYRKRNGLLTSGEIVSRRKAMGMSQFEFAQYLEVGIASVKRWEKAMVQDTANDKNIRRSTDHVLMFESGGYVVSEEPQLKEHVHACGGESVGSVTLQQIHWRIDYAVSAAA